MAYSNSCRGTFLFDDQQSIGENPTIRHLFSLGRVFSPPGDGATVQGRPILNLSLAFNYALNGAAPAGYHLGNLLIHLLASLVLFGLVRRTLRSDGIAFSAALLWALHPLQTESVTYIIQRAESLASLFYLLTLYCFVRGVEAAAVEAAARRFSPPASGEPPPPHSSLNLWHIYSLTCCLLGMGTKEIMVSAPLLVYAYDATFVSADWKAPFRLRRGYYLALAATWLPLAYLVATSHGRANTVGFGLARPAWQYWETQCPAIAHYLRLALWPSPLIFDRGYDLRWINHPADVIPYAIVVLLLVARTGYELARRTAAGFLGLWFFALLAPTSLVPGYLQTMAEHRMYLALAPVIVAVVALAAAEPKLRRWRIPLVIAVAAAAGTLTYRRNLDYATPLALWSDTVAKAPANPNSQYNLGNVDVDLNDYPAAIAHFRTAIELRPTFAAAYNNLGNALVFALDFNSAELEYNHAISLDPRYPDPHNNLANIYLRRGQIGDALREYRATLALAPNYVHAQNNLKRALQMQQADRAK